jgi:uncharacterized protein (DUF1800 family)
MTRTRSSMMAVVAALSVAAVLAARNRPKESSAADGHRRAVHALDRLTFGPRPGDADRVAAMGVEKWIDLQLHPDRIDNNALEARLAQYRTLQMSTRAMVLDFPPNPLLKAAMDGKVAIPNDPDRHAIYMAGIARLEDKQDEKQNAAAAQPTTDAAMLKPASGSETGRTGPAGTQGEPERREARAQVDSLILLPPDARMQRILRLPPGEQAVLLKGMQGPKKQALLAGLTPQQRETVIALNNPQAVVNYEVQSGKLLRAVYSDRQLEEVLTDFWFNHFNVYIGKGADRYLITAYERDVIRPRVLGKFKDLLVATAQSPAMLFYLDNWQSEGPDSPSATGQPRPQAAPRRGWVNGPFGPRPVAGYPNPHPQQPPGQPRQGQQKRRDGLNENYARELMELHTLGVNGGYTQHDVTEVARVFTGWTLEEPREGGGFVFKERLHEPGTKSVLGHKIKENGEKEGLQVLDMLAHSRSTAHFISLKLAQRFVADDPPPALVNQMAKTFLKSDGDLREVMRTLLTSQQFWAPEAYRAKVKTPFEFVVSALRATATDVTETQPLLNALNKMGMQIYGMQPPTGYSTNAETWVNSAALLDRMNFALSLVNNRIGGTHFDEANLLPGSSAANAFGDPYANQVRLEQLLLSGNISTETHETIEREIDAAHGLAPDAARPASTNTTVALLLGSPEFQRR